MPSVGRSSFVPVTAVVYAIGFDIHGVATYPVKWTALVNNVWDGSALTAIPSGLGLTFSFDGSSSAITTTIAGVWSFSAALNFPASDASWIGALFENFGGAGQQAVHPAAGGLALTTSATYALPSGASGGVSVETYAASTANPFTANAVLSIVRLA